MSLDIWQEPDHGPHKGICQHKGKKRLATYYTQVSWLKKKAVHTTINGKGSIARLREVS